MFGLPEEGIKAILLYLSVIITALGVSYMIDKMEEK